MSRAPTSSTGSWLPGLAAVYASVLVLVPSLAAKFIGLGPLFITGATLLFPLAFIVNNLVTEVYGLPACRRMIWVGFACQVLTAITYAVVGALPPAPFWHHQAAYEALLGGAPRIVVASVLASLGGELANTYVQHALKLLQRRQDGAALAGRFLAAGVVGQAVDSAGFLLIGFAGSVPLWPLARTIVSIYVAKVAYQVVALALSVRFAGWIKRAEDRQATHSR